MSAQELPRRHPLVHRVLVGIGVAIIIAMIVGVARFNAAQPHAADLRLPSSLLFQLRDDDGLAVVSALVTPDVGDWLLFPSDLTVGNGLTLSESAVGIDVRRSGQSLADYVRVEPGETWQLDRLGLAALVDSVGGVWVTPEESLRLPAGDGSYSMLWAGETIKLQADDASLYAVTGSPAQQAARTEQVLRELLRRLDGGTLSALLPAVGSSSRSTLDSPYLVQLIERIQQLNAVRPLKFAPLASELRVTDAGVTRALTVDSLAKVKAAGSLIYPEP